MRYRWPGLGAPLAASNRLIDASRPGRDMVAPRLQVPLTALLRIPSARRALVQEQSLTGILEIHLAWDRESVSIAGEQVPIENEPSAALALTFTGVPIFELETLGLLGRLSGVLQERPRLVSATPLSARDSSRSSSCTARARASCNGRRCSMSTRRPGDPQSLPILVLPIRLGQPNRAVVARLREAVTTAVARLDPDGRDPALRQMILIGHSQGGLLVKMQVVSTGDQLWNAVSSKPLDELKLSEDRDLFRRGLFVEPSPNVTRVIFVCTRIAGVSWHLGAFSPTSREGC